MEYIPTPSGPDVNRLIVPDDLLKQVQEARERFHTAKADLEKAMDEAEYDHGRHVKERYAELRKVEAELEDLTGKVQEILGRKV
jgi:hypothetical protein